jgi:hypothetical protein
MATDTTVTSTSYGGVDRTWLLGHRKDGMASGQIDWTAFTEDTHYDADTRIIKSGTVLGVVTATGKLGAYAGTTDEVQTLTVGGSGLTSFTITYSGQTTASLDDQATAAQVQTALEALSNIAPGDVTVTGSAGGPWTLTFGGTLADTNVAAVTTTPTGGTGVVNVATTTAGGADGSATGTEVAVGHLWDDEVVPTDTAQVSTVAYVKSFAVISESRLPSGAGLDEAAKSDLSLNDYRA